jgi:hypothetical protein
MARLAGQLVEAAAERGIELTGANGLLTALTRQVLQPALEAEMSAHLGYAKHDQRDGEHELRAMLAIIGVVCTDLGHVENRADGHAISDRLAVSEELVVVVIATLAAADVGEVLDELDPLDPFDHFETELHLIAQSQRCTMTEG